VPLNRLLVASFSGFMYSTEERVTLLIADDNFTSLALETAGQLCPCFVSTMNIQQLVV
jgi:hypothetical protein